MTNFHMTATPSRNSKTGPIFVSTSSATTCPQACPFNNKGGCYAAGGPLAMHWRKVTEGATGTDYAGFLDKVRKLPKGATWRHNAAGDLAGEGDALDIQALSELIQANKGRKGFTYTHKPLRDGHERDMVAIANMNGFTINLSGNNPAHADKLADLGIGPVVTVLPADQLENTTTPAGRKIVVCPAVVRDDVSCATCGLCAKPSRSAIVGFPAHGASKRKAEANSKGAAQ
ncbi:hypothetical protein UFOVP6_7 [uncultured Caudovirales phage]|uniref:DUF7227 domain-containing protein n=1 Tax=uncultured Caudovirales phage TaxID=2100421 RepID=A0A6J5KI41_9CAUD|nr:hypothetical protein UFOVP6_7 [uncultured Caudovirales phage]